MAVTDTHKDYQKMLPRWEMMRDVTSGSRAVKSKRDKYLPVTYNCYGSNEDRLRYEAYLLRAVFYPVTKDTMINHVGLAFAEEPKFNEGNLPFLKYDADGAGVSIYQLNQRALKDLLRYSRAGFFIDYPQIQGGATKADVERGIRPTIVYYDAFQIINWHVGAFGAKKKLSLVVLHEKKSVQDPHNEFGLVDANIYRVLRLDENEEYSVQIYSDESGQLIESDVIYPTRNGKRWNEIPFIFLGAQSNDANIDEIPLESLAEVNLAHYQNSAEYEGSVFICGQVQPVINELSEEWRDHLEKTGIKLGSGVPLLLPQGSTFQYVQAAPNPLCKEAMDGKFSYMQALGAKVLDKAIANKTATQVDSENMTQHSVLSLCVANLNEANEYALQWCADYQNVENDAQFSIKQDFAVGEIDNELLKIYQEEVVSQRMSKQTFHTIKQTGKMPEVTYEDEMMQIEREQDERI